MSSLPESIKKIRSKMKALEWSQAFSHYINLWELSVAMETRDDIDVLVTCKYEEDPIKNEGARVDTTFSPLLPFGSYPLPWTPEFRSDLAQNLMQPFPHPNDGSDKISLRLANWLRRYSSSKLFTHGLGKR